MSRDVLLVGGVGLENAETVFRTLSQTLGDHLPRLTDGETGFARSVWIQCQVPFFFGNPQLEQVEPDPERPGQMRPARVPAKGLYSHTADGRYMGRSRLRAGVDASELRFDNLGYADWAIESYGSFRRLKQEGVVAPATRFQVCLPSVRVVCQSRCLPEALPAILPAYANAMRAEIARIAAAVPHDELSVQWDCTEPVAFESSAASGSPSGQGAAQMLQSAGVGSGPVARAEMLRWLIDYASYVPEDVELGYHLCYGDFEHKHGLQPPSLAVCVEMANAIAGGVQRPIGWLHMPVPRDRKDEAYVAPLRELRLHPETRLYLGLVHHTDGIEGTRERMAVASRVYADYGIATECGWGRRPPETLPALLRIHAEAASLS